MSAGDARRRLEMPDVRLDRADEERTVASSAARDGAAPSARDLDRIAERRAGAVRLDVVDVAAGSTPRRAERLRDRPLLRAAVRHGEAAAAAVLVDRRAAR